MFKNIHYYDILFLDYKKEIYNMKDIKEKILTFIINDDNEFLLLKNLDKDPQFHKSFWYVVTGSCEIEDKDIFETVKREVKEETNLDVIETIYLNKTFKYESLGFNCIEYAFLSKVTKDKIILNEEHVDYMWCTFNEFIKKVHWFESKENLILLLKKISSNQLN